MRKRCMIVTGGGDCPGLNAVIRAIVKRAQQTPEWEIVGSINAFNGILTDPIELMELTNDKIAGIHVRGGTILGTTNKGGPFAWPVKQKNGKMIAKDRSDELINRMNELGIEAVINIGGDGSQKISQKLFEKGCNIIGVPKTIDNDLSATDYTFGFQTAVEIATDAVDKLVTTAFSHHRVMILEVMGREAGWIALHAAIAGGAEICLIPEIPYDIKKIVKTVNERTTGDSGFANIVIAEGARPKGGKMTYKRSNEFGHEKIKLGGAGIALENQLQEEGIHADIRTTILGHLQRGGIPSAFDRILATQMGVKAFEMVLNKQYGQMVAYRHPDLIAVPIKQAIAEPNLVQLNSPLMETARGVGIQFAE
ncbi:MAG: ATP-dependent phosphofructokinase / diphosphate-dependent phosphofructokinase [Candidatus Cloacimonadota bacterium]|nr:ATP-dependent phosphofructokinase / diphosphate-dependent phosphofructokinase [Candidatus Cloacimonadota bacterium]